MFYFANAVLVCFWGGLNSHRHSFFLLSPKEWIPTHTPVIKVWAHAQAVFSSVTVTSRACPAAVQKNFMLPYPSRRRCHTHRTCITQGVPRRRANKKSRVSAPLPGDAEETIMSDVGLKAVCHSVNSKVSVDSLSEMSLSQTIREPRQKFVRWQANAPLYLPVFFCFFFGAVNCGGPESQRGWGKFLLHKALL